MSPYGMKGFNTIHYWHMDVHEYQVERGVLLVSL